MEQSALVKLNLIFSFLAPVTLIVKYVGGPVMLQARSPASAPLKCPSDHSLFEILGHLKKIK